MALAMVNSCSQGEIKIGTGFNVEEDGTISVPPIYYATTEEAGLMSSSDKKKLNGVENGAQANKLEKIKINGVEQPIEDKSINIELSDDYASKDEVNVLSTTPSTVDGKIWFDFEDHQPVLKMFYGGEVVTFIGRDNKPEGAQTYYFSSDTPNYIEDYSPSDIVILGEGLYIADANFVTRNEFKDLVLTFAEGSKATIQTTTASALENLATLGRTIYFIDPDERRHQITFYPDGRAVEHEAVTITSDYANDSFDATDYTNVLAAKSPISILGGANPTTMRCGANSDTLVGNSGNDTFTGGAGEDLFVVKLTGDNVITDFDPAVDRISLTSGNMNDLAGVTSTDNGTNLDFGSGTLELHGFDTGNAVTINNVPYLFGNGVILNHDRTSSTVFAGAAVDLGSDTLYSNVANVKAIGGSVKAGTSPVTLTGSDATLSGGNGADTFLFTGDNITIQNYESSDQISLQSGFTVDSWTRNYFESRTTLNVADSQIVFDTLDSDTEVTIWQNGVSSSNKFREFIFSDANPRAATAVTLLGNYGDLGVQGDSLDSGYKNGTPHYYNMIYTLQTSQADSTIVGNSRPNHFYTTAGTKNVLTGGLGMDQYYFKTSGGVVTDFGIGTTKSQYTGAVTFAASPTLPAYDRNDPFTYSEGIDNLRVEGQVTSVAFEGYGNATSKRTNTFTAYVTYTSWEDGETYTVALTNIYKKQQAGNVWQTNNEAATTLKIWSMQTATSEMALLPSNTIEYLCDDLEGSRGKLTDKAKANIVALDSFMIKKALMLGLTVDGNTMNDIPSTNFIADANGQNLGGTDISKRTTTKKKLTT